MKTFMKIAASSAADRFLPAKPTGLTATIVNENLVRLDWQDNADNETGYKIYRSIFGDFGYVKLGLDQSANTETYNEDQAGPGVLYYYKVSAYNAYGEVFSDYITCGPIVAELSVVCPAITPVLGADLITNGDFETGDPPDDWLFAGDCTLSAAADERTGGAGSKCILSTRASGTYTSAYQAVALTAGTWYDVRVWAKNVAAGYLSSAVYNQAWNIGQYTGWRDAATWGQIGGTVRALTATSYISLVGTDGSDGAYAKFDDAVMKPITFSSMTSYLGEHGFKNGTYICHPTVAAYTQAGMLIEYLNASNFMMVIVNRSIGTAEWIRCLAGVYSGGAGIISYGAGKELKMIVNGTSHSLFYDGVAVGAAQVIDNSGLGLGVYGFSTLAANSVGTVTTTNATS